MTENGFMLSTLFVSPVDEKTVTVGIPTVLIRGDVCYWGLLMAAALLVGLPVATFYNLFLDHFIRGLTGGAAW